MIYIMIKLQVTLFSTTGKYRPISTLIEVENVEYYKAHAQEVQKRAIQKMCAQRYVDWDWMKEGGYTKMKVRVYDRAKIDAENKERYERIKKERGWA